MTDRKRADVNVLLQGANAIVAFLLLVNLFLGTANEFVNAHSFGLGLLFCSQTFVALLIERQRRDPFVILFAFVMIPYFELRLLTLAAFPFSTVFDRYPYGTSDTNQALVFMLIANTLLHAGLLMVRLGADRVVRTEAWKATTPAAAIVLMAVLFARMYIGGAYALIESLPRGLAVFQILLVPDIVVPMALGYYLLFRKSLSRRAAFTIGALLFLEIVAHTLWGSRGAIPVLVQTILLVALAVNSSVSISRRLVWLGIALFPVFAAGMIAVFAISTYNRVSRDVGTTSLSVGAAFANARAAGTEAISQSIDVIVPPAVARAGYFDFSAEMIAHRDEYRGVMNVSAYVRSIIDNILTPGFDVFDQPKLSNAMRFSYEQEGQPSKQRSAEEYHSDQFGIYGELYELFAWASLPLFFVIPYGLKRYYVRLRARNPFALTMKRVLVLFVFVKLVNSFGIDWIIGEMIPLIGGMFVYSIFFSSEKTTPATDVDSGPPLQPDPVPT